MRGNYILLLNDLFDTFFIFTLSFSLTQLDDATIQVYKDGDYGAYLDLESSLAEQAEEIEGLHSKYVLSIELMNNIVRYGGEQCVSIARQSHLA